MIDVECQFCEWRGSFADGRKHRYEFQHLLKRADGKPIVRLPWRVDQDSDKGIEILDDAGNSVAFERWDRLSIHEGETYECAIQQVRANYYAIIQAVNSYFPHRNNWQARPEAEFTRKKEMD